MKSSSGTTTTSTKTAQVTDDAVRERISADRTDAEGALLEVRRTLDAIAEAVDVHAGRIDGLAPNGEEDLGDLILLLVRQAQRGVGCAEDNVTRMFRAAALPDPVERG